MMDVHTFLGKEVQVRSPQLGDNDASPETYNLQDMKTRFMVVKLLLVFYIFEYLFSYIHMYCTYIHTHTYTHTYTHTHTCTNIKASKHILLHINLYNRYIHNMHRYIHTVKLGKYIIRTVYVHIYCIDFSNEYVMNITFLSSFVHTGLLPQDILDEENDFIRRCIADDDSIRYAFGVCMFVCMYVCMLTRP